MITPTFGLTATERVLPKLALDFTTAVLDARVTVTRTTNATNPATYINSSGVITAATNNQPRFDYDPVTLLCRGLLIEEARANSLLNTDLLATQTVTVTAAIRTLSFYGAGTVTLSGTHTAVVSGTGAYPTRTTYSFTPSAGVLTLTVTGTVQFAQLEAGAFATSYIPTTTTSLTRNADGVSMTGTNFSDWYNASEGTFLFRAASPNATGASTKVIFAATDGTANNRIRSYMLGTIGSQVTVGGVGQATLVDGLVLANDTFYNGVLGYKANNFGLSVNAITPLVDTSGTVPTIDQLDIGAQVGVAFLNGYIQKLFYYPQKLTTNEIQAFSKG
jgi:hypothetical protein